MNWRALVVVVVLGVVIAGAIRSLQGSPEAEFTAHEEAMLEGLAPVLDTLVLQQEDLSSLPGHYEACEASGAYGLVFHFRSGGTSGGLEDIVRTEQYDAPADYSSFCGFDSGAFLSSVVALPYDKAHLLDMKAVDTDLAGAEGEDLRKLAEATSGDLLPQEELVAHRWLKAPALGDTRTAWARTVVNLDTDAQFQIYHFDFTRGVVLAGLLVKLPSSPAADDEARAVARAFDNRIAAQLESLAAEVQAQ